MLTTVESNLRELLSAPATGQIQRFTLKTLSFYCAVLALWATVASRSEAGVLTFDWVTQGDTGSFGNVFSAVRGQVTLQDNLSNQMASSIVITSLPSEFDANKLLAAGNIATNWIHQVSNSFDVLNGVVTRARFDAFTNTNQSGNAPYLRIGFVDFQQRAYFQEAPGNGTFKTAVDENLPVGGNFSVHTPATVPEPASLAVWGGFGLVGLVAGWRQRRMRRALAASA